MNKESYIDELRNRLHSLPFEERESAISYYTEYLNDAGPQGEMRAIEELGSPAKVASQILADFAISSSKMGYSDDRHSKTTKKNKFFQLFAIVGGIFAAPIALPLAFALIITLLSLFIAAGAIVFSLYVVCAACIGSGAVVFAVGFYFLLTEFATGIVCIGGGLTIFGIGLIFLVPSRITFSFLSKTVLNFTANIYGKVRGGAVQ